MRERPCKFFCIFSLDFLYFFSKHMQFFSNIRNSVDADVNFYVDARIRYITRHHKPFRSGVRFSE